MDFKYLVIPDFGAEPTKVGHLARVGDKLFFRDSAVSREVLLAGNTFSISDLIISDTSPELVFVETGATADEGRWSTLVDSDIYTFRTRTDADGAGEDIFIITRTGTTVDRFEFANGEFVITDGVLFLKETTTPGAIADHGGLYTKTDNALYFQDGSGAEHVVHCDAFSNLWFHTVTATPDTVAISTADIFTLIDSFENVRDEDSQGNVVGSPANDEMVIGANAPGIYEFSYHCSMKSAASSSQFLIVPGIQLNTVKNVASATAATPIVVTVTAHGLSNGDMVTIAGATGDTNVNGDFIVANKTADTFELNTLDGAQRATAGTYDAGTADITLVYPGNLLSRRIVSSADLGVAGNSGDFSLIAGDIVRIYVANIGATRDLEVTAINYNVTRFGD